MGVHESQSLIWERMIFQSRPFWSFATKKFYGFFPHTEGVSEEEFYRCVNRVQPDLIRVEADGEEGREGGRESREGENAIWRFFVRQNIRLPLTNPPPFPPSLPPSIAEVTYPLHIILRFELEQALLDGSLLPPALPEAWNTRMKSLLNVDVVKDEGRREGGVEGKGNAKGCLQDVHWAVGALGYFPSYTLGAMMAAQLYAQAKTEIENLEGEIEKGHFKVLREWLREKVHVRGSVCESMDELLMSVTGEPLNPTYFVNYLKEKYGELYELEKEGGKDDCEEWE